jgi:hypothetical protein
MWRGTILLEDCLGMEVTGVEGLKTRIRDVIITVNRGMLARTWKNLYWIFSVRHRVPTLKCAEWIKNICVCTHQIELVSHFSRRFIIFNWFVKLAKDFWAILYIKLKLWMFIYVFVSSLIGRERMHRFAPNLTFLFLETRKRTQQCQNSRISVPSSMPGDGCSCSSETKHDRRTAPIPKWVASKSRLHKHRPEPRKTALGSISGEDDICSSETKRDTKTALRPKLFASARIL